MIILLKIISGARYSGVPTKVFVSFPPKFLINLYIEYIRYISIFLLI